MTKILIDANIIIDVLAKENSWETSYEIFLLFSDNKAVGCIASKDASTTYYMLQKKYKELGYDSYKKRDAQIRPKLNTLFSFLHIVDVNEEDCHRALASSILDFEDAINIMCASRHKLDYILTNNLKDYKDSSVPCISPEDCLAMLLE